jgi:hypothetical protein
LRQRTALQYASLLFAAAALALPVATLALAAVPMRASRRIFGWRAFWIGHFAAALLLGLAGALPGAVALGLLTVLIGAYSEVEEHGSSIFVSACFAVIATAGSAAVGFSALIGKTKGSIVGQIHDEVAEVARQMAEYNPKIDINADAIFYQVPSLVAVLMIVALAMGLIWENRAMRALKRPRAEGLREQLVAFRVPDACVWLAMASILGAFALRGKYPVIEGASMNALNVFVALYFFQGLAVVAQALEAFKVGAFWRGFWYVMIVIQLHLLVSLLGFVDYWVDFRAKLPKGRPFQSNREA